MAKRLLALLLAVGMVVGAFAFRSSRDGDGGGGGDNGAGGGSRGTVVCAAELGPVCAAVPGATVEPAATTFERLVDARTAGAAGVSGWLVPGPWPAMVDDERARTSKSRLFTSPGTNLASTTLVAVARKGQLPAGCGTEVTWKCLGDAAQDPSFRIGGDALTTSGGLFLRAAALGGYFQRVDYATNDLDEDPNARPWLDNLNLRLNAAAGFGARSLDTFVLQQGSASVYLTDGAATGNVAGNANFEVRTPTPVVTVAVAYAPLPGGRGIDEDAALEALRAAGWKVQPNARTEGLPSPGVLLALRSA